MKKMILICAISVGMLSCEKFLRENSVDLVRPTNAQALDQLLVGEAYPVDNAVPLSQFIDMFSDDIQVNYANATNTVNALNNWRPAFLWERDMFERMQVNGLSNTNIWFNYYQKIKGCNVVLDALPTVTGTEAEKGNVRGQALALRAYYYFQLANLFGKTPSAEGAQPNTDPAVPLLLTAEVKDEPLARATVAEVYDKVIEDLREAQSLLDQYGTKNSIFRFSGTATQLLLSRVHLYRGNWDDCISAAGQVIARKGALKNLNDQKPVTATTTYQINNPVVSSEVIWAFGTNNDGGLFPIVSTFPNKGAYAASDNLLQAFTANDLRVPLYFRSFGWAPPGGTVASYYAASGKFAAATNSTRAFRNAEAYLNRAEAYVRKAIDGDQGAIALAVADINQLRRNRIDINSYRDTSFTNANDLFRFIKNERRRELCLEDTRWFDIKRWQEPIEHRFRSDANNEQVVRLEPGDPRYLLPIPLVVLERNKSLVPNP